MTKEEILDFVKLHGVSSSEKKLRTIKNNLFKTYWPFYKFTPSWGEFIYYLTYKENPICENGQKRNFKSFNTGYVGNSCSLRKEGKCLCLSKSNDLRKETNLKKYGVTHPLHLEIYKNKLKETNLKKYGVENVSQSKTIQIKKEKTWIQNYGVDHPFKNKKIIEKHKNNLIKKYGVDNVWAIPTLSGTIKDNVNKTMIEKYGNNNPQKVPKFKQSTIITNLKKYGTENPLSSDTIKSKVSQTMIKKYGCENPSSRHLPKEVQHIIHNEIEFKKFVRNKSPSKIISELGIHNTHCYKLIKKYNCEDIIDWTVKSFYENELYDYYKEYNPIKNDRIALKPKEIDIYFKEYNLGIEYNGIYWHSTKFKNKDYHLEKFLLAKKSEIYLYQFFEDEYISSKNTVLNIINGMLLPSVYCEISPIDINFIDYSEFSFDTLDTGTYFKFTNKDEICGIASITENYIQVILKRKIKNLIPILKKNFPSNIIKMNNRFPFYIGDALIIEPTIYTNNVYDAGHSFILI